MKVLCFASGKRTAYIALGLIDSRIKNLPYCGTALWIGKLFVGNRCVDMCVPIQCRDFLRAQFVLLYTRGRA